MASSKLTGSELAALGVYSLSTKFTSGVNDYSPGIGYSQQELPLRSISCLPPEKIGAAIHTFRRLFRGRGSFSLVDLMSIRQTKEFVDFNLIDHFNRLDEMLSFLQHYPQYFVIKNDTVSMPYNFTEDGLMKFVKKYRSPPKQRSQVPYELIESVSQCRRHVAKLKNRAIQNSPLVIALDCEGVKLGKEGPLTLLQIGTMEGEVFIFDILSTPNREDMFVSGGLKGLLEDKSILKVMHDCRNDQCALYFQFGVILTNVFDTSVAFTTLWDQCNVKRGPFRPKLTALLNLFDLEARHRTDHFVYEISNNKLFGKRPLTQEMLQYVTDEVQGLPVIYDTLNRLISSLWRPFLENQIERDLQESRIHDPQETYQRKKRLGLY